MLNSATPVEKNSTPQNVKSSIIDIKNISEVRQFLDTDTTLVWDIDNTILETTQLLGSDQWFAHYIGQKIQDGLSSQEAVMEALKIYVPVQKASKSRVVEPEVVDIIHQAQALGQSVFCLTSRGDLLEQATINQLASLGLDFNIGEFKDKIAKLYENTERLVSHGIIFSSGGSAKGDCFKQTFDLLNIPYPKRLVFIDDKRSYLNAVQEICEELGIEFLGVRYGFTDEKIAALNAEIAQKQLEKFHNPILTDEEAAILVQAKNKNSCAIRLDTQKQVGVLMGRALDFVTYSNILGLDDNMKKYRKKAKFIEVNGNMVLCVRFKIPFDKLSKLLPSMEELGILGSEIVQQIKAELEQSIVNSQKAIVYNYADVRALSDPDQPGFTHSKGAFKCI